MRKQRSCPIKATTHLYFPLLNAFKTRFRSVISLWCSISAELSNPSRVVSLSPVKQRHIVVATVRVSLQIYLLKLHLDHLEKRWQHTFYDCKDVSCYISHFHESSTYVDVVKEKKGLTSEIQKGIYSLSRPCFLPSFLSFNLLAHVNTPTGPQ